MGSIGDPLPEGDIPAVGTGGTAYASEIDLFLTEVKARLEAEVPKSSLEDGPLDMNGSPVINASYVGIPNGLSAPTTPNNTLQAFGNEVYWVSADGVVKLTEGGALNAGSIGGITGDYGGVNPAQFRFVDADQEYYAYDDFGAGAWARVWAKNFDIAAGPTSSTRVRLAYGGGASYTLTLPPTPLPVQPTLVQTDTSGNWTYDNTLGSTITATDFKHTAAHTITVEAGTGLSASHTLTALSYWVLDASANVVRVALPLEVGMQITSVSAYVRKLTGVGVTHQVRLFRHNFSTGAITAVGAGATLSTNNPGYTGFTETVSATVGAAESYSVDFNVSVGNGTNDEFHGINVTYTRT